jgi:hypothetical protein
VSSTTTTTTSAVLDASSDDTTSGSMLSESSSAVVDDDDDDDEYVEAHHAAPTTAAASMAVPTRAATTIELTSKVWHADHKYIFSINNTIPVASATEKTFTAYLLQVLDVETGEEATILRRYSQFELLNEKVQTSYVCFFRVSSSSERFAALDCCVVSEEAGAKVSAEKVCRQSAR